MKIEELVLDSLIKISDNKFIKRALNGDKEAFGKLFEKYVNNIYRFVYYKVSRKEDAEDITSQVFEKAFKGIHGFEPGSSFKAWLFTIARNSVIDFYRKRKEESLPDYIDDLTFSADELGKSLEIEDDVKFLLESMKKIKPVWKQIIEYKYFYELNNSEIAKLIDKPEGYVRVIQHRALKELRTLIDKK